MASMFHKRTFVCPKHLMIVIILVAFISSGGCSRRFYRNRADQEVMQILASKDKYPNWQIEQFHVMPDPRSRFASLGNPDRPPMPPDDPAAMKDAPNPQKPGKAGIAHMEGSGYLDVLQQFDSENRAVLAKSSDTGAPLKLVTFKQDGVENQPIQTLAMGQPKGKNKLNLFKQEEDSAREYIDPLASDTGPFDSMGLMFKGDPGGRYEKPFLINLEQACELGLFNNRDYQYRREDLYLAALPVTLQRFAFAAQFYATEVAIREGSARNTPQGATNRWDFTSNSGFTKTFSTGALLLFRFANEAVIEFSKNGPTTVKAPSIMALDVFQPLFQGGGRAVTLEPLTLAERGLLYQMRSYARFRKEFYADIIAGGSPITYSTPISVAPATRFNSVFGAGIGGAGAVQVSPGASSGAGATSQPPFSSQRVGYLYALLSAGQLRNERENVSDISTTLDQYREFQAVGDISELQVSRILQQLLNFKSSVITRELQLRNFLDQFKYQLGLPMDIPLELDNGPLRPQLEQLARYTNLVDEFKRARKDARKLGSPQDADRLRAGLRSIFLESEFVRGTEFTKRFPNQWKAWEDLTTEVLVEKLRNVNKERLDLQELKVKREKEGKTLGATEKKRLGELDFDFFLGRLERNLRTYEKKPWLRDGKVDALAQTNLFENLIEDFLLVFVEPRNERLMFTRKSWPKLPRLCVDGVDLLKVDLDEALFAAGRHALTNRLDLMNGRAQLMDSWRQIAIAANALQGAFNVEYNLNGFSPTQVAQPVNFSGSSLRNRLILSGELPLVRIQERNAYRATLINWQRQRRNLMAFEDTVLIDVRDEIRQLRAFSKNYEIQKQALELAYLVLDNALETTYAPSKPGGGGGAQGNSDGSQAAFTEQLLTTQRSKLAAQNVIFSIWIDYLATRAFLYRDLELMPLDNRGVWIDEVETCECGQSGDNPNLSPVPGQREPASPGKTDPFIRGTSYSSEGDAANAILLPPRKIGF
jgi:outer membrane protein TolC